MGAFGTNALNAILSLKAIEAIVSKKLIKM
jgi:hypothetical protein